jgi:low temperature requirement protein LtrA
LHIWSYAHFPLYLGLVVTGVGVQRIVTAAERRTLSGDEALLMTGAAAMVMVAMAVIGGAFGGRARVISTAVPAVTCSLLAMGLGLVATSSPLAPVIIILGLIGLSSAQALRVHASTRTSHG